MIDIKDKYMYGLKYKYHPYPRYECWEFAKNRVKFDFWFNRDYTGAEYYTGYTYKSRFNDPVVYASKAHSLLETNFCFDEYIYFRDIILDKVDGDMSYYDLRRKVQIPDDKLYIVLADMRLMGEINLTGTYSQGRKSYEFYRVGPVGYLENVLLKGDYILNVDEEFLLSLISQYGYYQFIR